jgi:hypothetical protein
MRLFTPSIVGSLLILGLALPPSALAGAGDLDPAFGVGGKVTTDFGFGLAGEDEATDVLKVKANKIVAVGWIFNPDNGTVDFALVRYDKHGNVDENERCCKCRRGRRPRPDHRRGISRDTLR